MFEMRRNVVYHDLTSHTFAKWIFTFSHCAWFTWNRGRHQVNWQSDRAASEKPPNKTGRQLKNPAWRIAAKQQGIPCTRSNETPEFPESSRLSARLSLSLSLSLACDYARGVVHIAMNETIRGKEKKKRDAKRGWEVKGRRTETKTREEERGWRKMDEEETVRDAIVKTGRQ